MPLTVVGLSHRTAPVEVRERLAFGRTEIPALLGRLRAGGAEEAAVLSTCNRTELYLSLPDAAAGEETARRLLAERCPGVEGVLYAHRDRDAVRHLFRVAAGLDSMIVGEPQIQGQVRDAYQAARETADADGPVVGAVLNRLFQHALGVGGRVRSETELGLGAASISSAAVELAKKIFGSLRGRRALVLGAGEMSELTLECLRSEGVMSRGVVNRTYARADDLASRAGGRAVPWEELEMELPDTDIVVCSTSAPHPVLTRERVRRALPGGAKHPLCIIDIAIPRDVEPEVGREPNVFLYNIDDLQQMVETNLGRRRDELPRAEAIVGDAVEEYWGWYAGLAVVPTIRELRAHGEALRRAEVERALRRLSHLAPEDREAVEALTRTLLNKLLHSPTVRLREAAGNGRGLSVLDSVRYLFQLGDADEAGAPGDEPPREEIPLSSAHPNESRTGT